MDRAPAGAPGGRSFLVVPQATTGLEVPIASLWLVAGLVLLFFPGDLARERLRWVAVGFLVLATGGLLLGYVLPFVVNIGSFNAVLYGSWLTRSVAGTLLAVGLWPAFPPPCSRRALWGTLAAFVGILVIATHWGTSCRRWPMSARWSTPCGAAPCPLRDLTGWHWILAVVPLAAVAAAAVGSARHYPGRLLGGWLLLGIVVWAGAQLHDTFWPAAFSPIVTPASRLRLVVAAFVTIGAMLEMQRVDVERAALLAELSPLRDDFIAMVAHELATPLAAMRRAAELAVADPLSPSQSRALSTVTREVGALNALVADVQLSAAVERDELLGDAACYARMLPGDHVVTWPQRAEAWVLADRARIGQVLRNLLGNAAKYSPPDAPIAVPCK